MAEANTEPSLLHTEVRGKGKLHQVPGGVQRQPVGRQAAELNVGVSRVHHDPVVDAAWGLLQVKVQEGELDDEAGRSLQDPLTGLRIGVFVGEAGRGDVPLRLSQDQVTGDRAAAQRWR